MPMMLLMLWHISGKKHYYSLTVDMLLRDLFGDLCVKYELNILYCIFDVFGAVSSANRALNM